MQTFLPYHDFEQSAHVLDNKRLGKQRVEAAQILAIHYGETVKLAWLHHPAVRMWRDYPINLIGYLHCVCVEWEERGFKNILIKPFLERMILHNGCVHTVPEIFTENFHLSHKSNLVRKLPEHYRKFFPDVPSDLPYVWPK